ncbi:MAG: hypothetical protein ACPGWR_24220 [Ardenticatenaceae bacterium]
MVEQAGMLVLPPKSTSRDACSTSQINKQGCLFYLCSWSESD